MRFCSFSVGGRFSPVAVALLSWLASSLAQSAAAQGFAEGAVLENPDWKLIITDYGYSDLALDNRPGFEGREFLSGEWAAAVHYGGGSQPAGPIWLPRRWVYPDWESNSPFGVKRPLSFADPQNPFNADHFPVFQSVLTNADLEITMTYEMLDTQTGLAQGNAPAGAGGPGAAIRSNRYVFRQTYRLVNQSGQPLTQFKFYQFLHALETATATFDNRDYGGALAEYRYDITQEGESFGLDARTGAVVLHHDVVAFHARQAPAAWEVGYYGRRGADSHVKGKPSIGVHLSVEADALSGRDFFAAPEERWVSGAQRFDFGTVPAGGEVLLEVLLSIQTRFDVRASGVVLEVLKLGLVNGKYRIEFREPQGLPVSFLLYESPRLQPFNEWTWTQVPVPAVLDSQRPGVMYFEVPADPKAPQRFYLVRPVF